MCGCVGGVGGGVGPGHQCDSMRLAETLFAMDLISLTLQDCTQVHTGACIFLHGV